MSWSDTEKNQLRRENAQLRAELKAVNDALADTKRFANMFARDWKAASEELEAAKKVADAAVKWQSAADQYTARHALFALRAVVAAYRAPLSPGKRAALNAALEKLDEMEKQ
jgi:hypothetical protein